MRGTKQSLELRAALEEIASYLAMTCSVMETINKPIKSYVLRQGRLTKAQQHALDNYWCDYGIEANAHPLDLKSLFDQESPVVLEIGFGNGESLVTQARDNPDKNFIGVEVHTPGVGHCLHRIHELGLNNIKVLRHDATLVLEQQIPENSLCCVQLFFPDPWHKKRHHKRRILQQNFIDTIYNKLEQGGLFHMATDWENYASHMRKEMDASTNFCLNSEQRGDRPETKFETRGLRLGHGVWDLIYEKI